MANYRSKPYSGGKMQLEPCNGPSIRPNDHFMRCYSVAYNNTTCSSYYYAAPPPPPPPQRSRRISTSWSFSDPEFQRKTRVASYKAYCVQGRVKGSFRKSFRWVKDRCTQVVYVCWWWFSKLLACLFAN